MFAMEMWAMNMAHDSTSTQRRCHLKKRHEYSGTEVKQTPLPRKHYLYDELLLLGAQRVIVRGHFEWVSLWLVAYGGLSLWCHFTELFGGEAVELGQQSSMDMKSIYYFIYPYIAVGVAIHSTKIVCLSYKACSKQNHSTGTIVPSYSPSQNIDS
eukprot:6233280-Amphidinium_carterae.1